MRINGSLGYVTVAHEGRRSERIFVIPRGQARIRTQMSAAHSTEDLKKAVRAFKKVGEKYRVIGPR
jgi:hypothetical protein